MQRRLTAAAAFAAGLFFGGAALHTLSARADEPFDAPRKIENPLGQETVTDVFFPGRREGYLVTDLGVYFAPAQTELEDLSPLGSTRVSEPGRFSLHTRDNSRDFFVLDTQTGVTTYYDLDGKRVRLFNTTTPNRALTAPLVDNYLHPSD